MVGACYLLTYVHPWAFRHVGFGVGSRYAGPGTYALRYLASKLASQQPGWQTSWVLRNEFGEIALEDLI
jgi:hypothetical protein